jgi:shikimate dehydrogenase
MKNYGIVGNPLAKNLTAILMNAALKHLKIDTEFKRFELDLQDEESLANFCYETDLNLIGGFAVAAPFKEDVMLYMDHYDPLCKIVGSANTVVNEQSKLFGYNTESIGALQALQEKTHIHGKRVLVIGTEDAGRGLAYSLKEFGAEVFVLDPDLEKAEALAKEFEIEAIEPKDIEQEQFDILINTTAIGAFPKRSESPLSQDQIPSHAVVMDLVMNPIRTQLLKGAEEVGALTISGERMLLHSAIRQFELWFGLDAPTDIMEEALYEELEKN